MYLFLIHLSMLLATSANAASLFGYNYSRSQMYNTTSNSSNNTNISPKDNNSDHFFDPAPKIKMPFLEQKFRQQQQQKQQQETSIQQSYGGNTYLPPTETKTDKPIIHKQFFVVSAAEEEPEQPMQRTKHIIIGRPQTNYRVVFIKAPTNDNSNLKFTAEYAPQEEKTVIYVLTKKGNDLNIDEIATPEPTKPSKPEIFFIKYKTSEEATAAQKEIQEQYDRLGGTSEFSDEGLLPVKSVVGSLDAMSTNEGYDYHKAQSAGDASILQPARFYF